MCSFGGNNLLLPRPKGMFVCKLFLIPSNDTRSRSQLRVRSQLKPEIHLKDLSFGSRNSLGTYWARAARGNMFAFMVAGVGSFH